MKCPGGIGEVLDMMGTGCVTPRDIEKFAFVIRGMIEGEGSLNVLTQRAGTLAGQFDFRVVGEQFWRHVRSAV
jgi:hypothetical protein